MPREETSKKENDRDIKIKSCQATQGGDVRGETFFPDLSKLMRFRGKKKRMEKRKEEKEKVVRLKLFVYVRMK